jgi:hypothetical protein
MVHLFYCTLILPLEFRYPAIPIGKGKKRWTDIDIGLATVDFLYTVPLGRSKTKKAISQVFWLLKLEVFDIFMVWCSCNM